MATQVAELQAGPELDALVAEKVMGWARCENHGNGYVDRPDGWGGMPPGTRYINDLPHYSTDIAAAWGLVSGYGMAWKLMTMFEGRKGSWAWCGQPAHEYASHITMHQGSAGPDEMPLAICRAALAAVTR